MKKFSKVPFQAIKSVSHFALIFQQAFRTYNITKEAHMFRDFDILMSKSRNGLQMSYENNPLSSLLQYHMHGYGKWALTNTDEVAGSVSSSVYTRRSLRYSGHQRPLPGEWGWNKVF